MEQSNDYLPKNTKKLLTMNQAVDLLKVSKPTMYRLLEQGKIHGNKVGNQWRFKQDDLMAYLERGPISSMFSDISVEDIKAEIQFFKDQLRGTGRDIAAFNIETDDREALIKIFMDVFLELSLTLRASDIHFEAFREERDVYYLLRLRIDGVLQELCRIRYKVAEALLVYFKNQMNMDLETRLPQDGRIKLRFDERGFDLCFMFMPAIFGASVVIKVLDPENILLELDQIGLSPEDISRINSWKAKSYGLILISGPGGSGKSTLFYSLLKELSYNNRKTISLEDPVEIIIRWATQIQIKPDAGLNFSNSLRGIMRQDPDIIMIDTIKDLATMKGALHAALNGHLVIGTINSPNAISSIEKVIEMGIEHYALSRALIGIIGTQLLRKLCIYCKRPVKLFDNNSNMISHEYNKTFTATGCSNCLKSGYKGRTGLFELLECNDELAECIMDSKYKNTVPKYIQENKIPLFYDNGLKMAAEGTTSLEELTRVISLSI